MNGTETGSAILAELCDLISEQVHPADVPEALYVGLEHVTPGRLRRSGGGIAADVQSHKYAFRRNDILYGKLRPYLDKAILADTDGVCTTELLVLRAKPGVDPRFLACLVHDPDFVEHALTGVTGAHHPRTSWAHIAQFERPRFSFEEQRTIAGLLWRTQDLLRACEDTIEAAQKLKQVAMRELFTRGLRGEPQKETEIGPVPESWGIRTVAESVHPFRFDRSKQVPKSAYQKVGCWPVIDQGQEDVAGYTNDSEKVITPDRPIIIFGDHTRIFKFVDFPFVLGADGTKPLLARDEFIPKFLFYALSALEIPARGYNRHFTVLSEMNVPEPALDEQRDIVAILDAIDRKIELHRKKRTVLEELFKALLHKLMTGEIRVDALDLSALQVHAEPPSPSAEPAV